MKPLYDVFIDIPRGTYIGFGHTWSRTPSHWGLTASVTDHSDQPIEAFVLGCRDFKYNGIMAVVPIAFHKIQEKNSKLPPRECLLFAEPHEYRSNVQELEAEYKTLVHFMGIHYNVTAGGDEHAAQAMLKYLLKTALHR